MNSKKKNANHKNMPAIVYVLRISLIISILFNLAKITFNIIDAKNSSGIYIYNQISKDVEIELWTILTLILCFLPEFLDTRIKIHLPIIFETIIVIFIYCAIFLSVRFDLYYRFFWWDDLLHATSGIIIGFIGAIYIYIINKRYSMNLSPRLIAVFTFAFAVSLGVLWEMFEFTIDVFFGTANQKWDLPPDTNLIILGKPYQGSGLRDTMSDLIINAFGALIAAVSNFFIYIRDRKKALKLLRKIAPGK
ncbi:MAG: hypothetical protein KA120_02890 [Candidatus Goldbacteria bacterium]|nr:hypothetical protein [Candidatus Goldiibacteriota bacterium]